MSLKSETKQKAHTREEFIDYFDSWIGKYEKGLFDEIPGFIKVEKWGLETYREAKNQCLGCGCPEDSPNMKISTNAYYCLICDKKMLGEDIHNLKQEKLNNWEDKTQGMNLKEKFKLVKKSLMFGG